MVRRIATTEPGSTEIVAYIDQGTSRIVAVSDKCDYPPEVIAKPKIVRSLLRVSDELPSEEIDRVFKEHLRGGKPLYEVDWNLIEELDPDLIVGQTLCSVCAFPLISPIRGSLVTGRPVGRYRRFRPRVVATYAPKTFMGIAWEGYRLSKIMGREARGLELLKLFEEALDELKGVGRGLRTVVIEWIKPLYAAGLWVSDLVEASGSKHIIGAGSEGRRVEWEDIRAFDPEVLIVSPCGFTIERTMRELHILESMPGWRDLSAVKRGSVYVVDSAYTSRPGPRVIKFAEMLADLYTGGGVDKEVAIKIY